MTPTELILKPGESVALTVRSVRREAARPIALPGPATWTLENLKGTIADGKFTADTAAGAQAGTGQGDGRDDHRRRAHSRDPGSAVDASTSRTAARCRRRSGSNATGKFAVRDLDGSKVLVKLAENAFAFAKRCRPFFGGTDYSNYTIEADVRAMETSPPDGRHRHRRAALRAGAVRQPPADSSCSRGSRRRSARCKVDSTWKTDTWYTMKLEVQTLGGGKVRARGKVWPKGGAEPAAWTIERVDPIGNHQGRPGLYADAPSRAGGGSELYYDNIKVYKNK